MYTLFKNLAQLSWKLEKIVFKSSLYFTMVFPKIVWQLLSMTVLCSSLRPKYNLMTTDAWKRRKFSSSSPAASKASIASSFSSSSQKELAVVSYCVLLFSCCVCRILALALDVRIESYIVCLSSFDTGMQRGELSLK